VAAAAWRVLLLRQHSNHRLALARISETMRSGDLSSLYLFPITTSPQGEKKPSKKPSLVLFI
jgi:hypothetical protein